MADDPELAADLVRAAGGLAARMLRDGLETRHKTSVSDVVSAADHAAEALVVERLRAERPQDGLVGEEGARFAGARTWYVDPVDGTYNFLSGIPLWCSALGLVTDGVPVLGAVYQPTTDELWVGGRDVPTTHNGVEVACLVDRPLSELSLTTYLHPSRIGDEGLRLPLLRALGGAATVRMLGSGSVELAAVATGRVGAFLQVDSAPWDWYPGAALVHAAGGDALVVEAHGHHWHLAGGPQVVAELVHLVTAPL